MTFVYKARNPELWKRHVAMPNLSEEQRQAITNLVYLLWLEFLDGFWTTGDEISWFDSLDCLRDLEEKEFDDAFDAECVRMGAYYAPDCWQIFLRWLELRNIDRTEQEETEFRLIEVERALDGAA